MSSLLCRDQHFLSNSRGPYPQEGLFWDHGAGCCQVWSTRISVGWVCIPTLRIFTLKMFSTLILKADRDPCGQRCQAGAWLWSLLLAPIPVPGTTSPRDSELLTQRLLLWHICAPPTWIPSTGSPTGVSSSRVPADSGHGSLVLGLMHGGSEEPQRAGRGAHPPLACSTSRFGLPHSHHTFSVLLHTPHPKSLPACLQISLGGQPVVVCPLNLWFYS